LQRNICNSRWHVFVLTLLADCFSEGMACEAEWLQRHWSCDSCTVNADRERNTRSLPASQQPDWISACEGVRAYGSFQTV